MKKFILGLVFGLAIAIPVAAHGEAISMIGKVIDGAFSIKINGKTLTNQALTIDGVSYVPTREFAESLGAIVKFDANLGIDVVPPATRPLVENPIMKPYRELNDKLNKLVDEKQSIEKQINDIYLKNLQSGKVDGDDISKLKQQVADKQAQIDKLVIDKGALELQMQK